MIKTKVNNTQKKVKKITTKVNNTRLPDTYQEVEYVESTGYQGINTGIEIDLDETFQIEMEVLINQYNTDGSKFIGWSAGSTSISKKNAYAYGMYNQGTNYTHFFSFGSVSNTSNSFTFGVKHKIVQNLTTPAVRAGNSTASMYIDDTLFLEANGKFNNYNGKPKIYIFAGNAYDGQKPSDPAKMKLYSLKITKNNTLVRNMVPCYRISDTKPGLYDLANGVFYPGLGSENLLKGNDVSSAMKEIKKIMTKVNGTMKTIFDKKS